MHFDYIISGAGASGMSLLYRMMKHSFFTEKKILVVDKAPKNNNDHTWCFWEKEEGVFETIVHHQWEQVHFYSNHFSNLLHTQPYRYKMIRSIDLYRFIMTEAANHPNVTFVYGHVENVDVMYDKAIAIIDGKQYSADYIFNSILFEKIVVPANKHLLLQHFKGFVIKTPEPVFDPSTAVLMDFRISQRHGAAFMYVLPVASNKALVEYTLFTKDLLQPNDYNSGLAGYINDVLKINEYAIIDEEFGVIPMTNVHFAKRKKNIINIGTAGGNTKPSTGYTFQFIQKQCHDIINALVNDKLIIKDTFDTKKFMWYDSVLLNVLVNKRMPADRLFARLFQKNKVHSVFKFLDNESTVITDLSIINSLPKWPFIKAAIAEIF